MAYSKQESKQHMESIHVHIERLHIEVQISMQFTLVYGGPQIRGDIKSVETKASYHGYSKMYHGQKRTMAYYVIAMSWQHCLRDDLETY